MLGITNPQRIAIMFIFHKVGNPGNAKINNSLLCQKIMHFEYIVVLIKAVQLFNVVTPLQPLVVIINIRIHLCFCMALLLFDLELSLVCYFWFVWFHSLSFKVCDHLLWHLPEQLLFQLISSHLWIIIHELNYVPLLISLLEVLVKFLTY